jgi:hypothetical protein
LPPPQAAQHAAVEIEVAHPRDTSSRPAIRWRTGPRASRRRGTRAAWRGRGAQQAIDFVQRQEPRQGFQVRGAMHVGGRTAATSRRPDGGRTSAPRSARAPPNGRQAPAIRSRTNSGSHRGAPASLPPAPEVALELAQSRRTPPRCCAPCRARR